MKFIFYKVLSKMIDMRFVDRFKDFCAKQGTSPHKAAQEVGEDTTLVSKWINGKRDVTPERLMTLLKNYAQSETLSTDFPTLAAWWAMDYLPPESFKIGFEAYNAYKDLEKYPKDKVSKALELVSRQKNKNPK